MVEAVGAARAGVTALEVCPLTLNLRSDVLAYLELRDAINPDIEKAVKEAAMRMANLI